MTEALPALSNRVAQVLAIDPAAPALEFERQWYAWADLAATAEAVRAHVEPGERVAVHYHRKNQESFRYVAARVRPLGPGVDESELPASGG